MIKKPYWVCYISMLLLLSSYVTSPVQIIAQEISERESVTEDVTQTSELIENQEEVIHEKKLKSESIFDFKNDSDEETELIDLEDSNFEISKAIVESSGMRNNHEEVSITTGSSATLSTMTDSLIAIGVDITKIKKLTVKGMTSVSGPWLGLGHTILANYTSLEYLELSDVVTVGSYAFSGAASVIELYLPKALSIGTGALRGMNNINRLEAPEVRSISAGNFDRGNNTLMYLITPKWGNIDVNLFDAFAQGTLYELSSGSFNTILGASVFSALRKQTINRNVGNAGTTLDLGGIYTTFINVRELTVNDFSAMNANNVWGQHTGLIESVSSDSLTEVNFGNKFPNLSKIDFEEKLTVVRNSAFSGTKITTLNLKSVGLLEPNGFLGAAALKEVFLPSLPSLVSGATTIPASLKFVGLSSSNLEIFRATAIANPSTLFAVTEKVTLPLRDRIVPAGLAAMLEADFSSFMLNDSFESTEFSAEYLWYFEGNVIGDSANYLISDMNESNVGSYSYGVNIKGTTGLSFETSLVSETAQVDLQKAQVEFMSDFSISSAIGNLEELSITFKSNTASSNPRFEIYIPEFLTIDLHNIKLVQVLFGEALQSATYTFDNQVLSISDFSLIGDEVDYRIDIPIMPIGLNSENEKIQVKYSGHDFQSVQASGEISIESGEFKVSIPNIINFGEVSISSSHINSSIEKVDQLDIDIISFTGIEESWEIMVSATPFKNKDGKEIDEGIIRLVYQQDEDLKSLSDELLFSEGYLSGNLSYDFQTNLWENNSHVISQMQHEGFKIFVGNEYYKLEEKQSYTAEVNFTILYSP
ncbi:hypothetical protein IGI86_002652 [Enterococcus sp. AZ188]|uniref:leucine-rich repeat protein n=1 Tax=Enterococcus sp. AZ188 TaxID=2774678 RepID=UPI003D2FA228